VAKAADAAAKNTAGLQDANLKTNTSQFNAGQAECRAVAGRCCANTWKATELASNTQKYLGDLQSNTSLTIQDKQAAVSTLIANIQSNTTLTAQDKQMRPSSPSSPARARCRSTSASSSPARR
jgi:hypothetical protein